MNKYKDAFFELVLRFCNWLEDLADIIRSPAITYFRDYCKYCGSEGGYGHKKGCPKLKGF